MHDFDFFVGTWDTINRRLLKALAGCTEWDEFPATSQATTMLGGLANIDEIAFPTKGYNGMTVRLFDPETKEWCLYWMSSRTPVMTVPQVGHFVDGVGDFLGDDIYEGQAIRVRYLWSGISATTARWEQAFSVDGEKTWETNWTMDMTRRV